jgi:hypothetical protein
MFQKLDIIFWGGLLKGDWGGGRKIGAKREAKKNALKILQKFTH